MSTIRSVLTEAVASYTERSVTSLRYVRDPKHAHTYGVRARVDGLDYDIDFLIYLTQGKIDLDAGIEEVEFTTWPPEVVS